MKNINKINWLRGGSTLRQTGQVSAKSHTMWRYAAMVTLLLTLACGNVWGASPYNLDITSYAWGGTGNKSANDGTVTIRGYIQSKTYNNTGSTKVAFLDGTNYLTVSATSACITSITVTANTDNNSNNHQIAYQTSADGSSWSASTNIGTCANRQSAPTSRTANFSPAVQYVRFTKGGSNSISVGAISITYSSGVTHTVTAATDDEDKGTAAAGSTTVAEGATTTITATPKSGYKFDHWTVSGTGATLSSTSTNPTTLTMGTANATVTAYFVEKVCPSSGTVFSMTMLSKVTGSDKSLTASETVDLGSDSYATVSDGTATFSNTGSAKGKITRDSPNKLRWDANAVYLKLDFDCELQTGDSIIISGVSGCELSFTKTTSYAAADSTSVIDGKHCFIVPAGYNGVSTIYGWRSRGTSLYITGLKVTRPAAVSTYTVSATVNPDGYGTLSASSISSVASGTAISTLSNVLTVGASSITATATSQTSQYSYAFSNWTKGDGTALPATVTGDLAVRANFSRTARSYTVTHSLSNVTTSSGTTATYGTDYTATFAASSGYALPSTITVTRGGSTLTGGGTHYTWNSGTGELTINGDQNTGNITVSITGDALCLAPTAVYVTQTAGTADLIAGESFTLSAATSTGVEDGATYQWYRGDTPVGTNSPTFTVASCTSIDAGTYWCKITNPCSEDAHTTNVTGYGIKVWQVLLYSSSWNAYDLTSTGTKTGSLSRQLAPGTYYIKLTHNNGVDFGVNTGGTISDINATTESPWTLYNGQNNIRLNVSTAGSYTFDVDYTSADNPTLSVTYPPATISSCDKIYFCPTQNSIATGSAKFSIYFWNDTENGWANCYLVDGTEYADDAKYVAFAPSTTNGWKKMIVVRDDEYASSFSGIWNQSQDITYNGYDYIVGTGWSDGKFTNNINSFYSSTTPAMSASSYATTVGETTNASTNLTGATITYASDNTSVATVNSSGVITGVAVGETTITASVGSCTVGTATVTISRNTPTQYTVSGTTAICSGDNTNITLSGSQTGASYQLKKGGVAEGDAKAGTGNALTWNVSAAGTYTVSAVQTEKYSARDMSGSAVITVKTPVTASWSTSPANGTAGGNMNATLTTNYASGVVYTSSNPSVASVSGNGTTTCAITYASAGSARITATVTGAGEDYCSTASVYTDITVAEPSYGVTYLGSGRSKTSGGSTATHNTDFTATFTQNPYHTLRSSITVTIGGETATQGTEYTWSRSAGVGTVTIDGDYITGAIVITVNADANPYDVTLSYDDDKVSKESGSEGTAAAHYYSNYVATFQAKSGYALQSDVTVTIGESTATKGTEYTWSVSEGVGTLTIGGSYITDDIEVAVDADADVTTYSVTYAAGVTLTSGSAPDDVTDLDNGDQVTIAGNTGEMVYGSNVFRGWTDGTTFYLPDDKITISGSDVDLTAVWDSGSGSCTEYEVLLSNGSVTQESSTKPYGQYITGRGKIMRKGDGSDVTDLTTGGSCHSSTKYFQTGSGVIGLQTYNAINKVTVYAIATGGRTLSSIKTGTTLGTYGDDIQGDCEVIINGETDSPTSHITWSKNVCGEIEITFPNTLAANSYILITFSGNLYVYGAKFENCVVSNFKVSFADQTGFAGSSTLPDPIVGVPTGKKVLQPSNPTAAGYTFGGWYSNAACTAGNEIDWDEMTITADKTIYAKWTEKSTPTSYTLSAAASSVCSGNSTTINLSGSQSGITYELYEGESKLREVAGTGSALSLGATSDLTTSKTYSVKTVENATYKAITMASTVTVNINAAANIGTQPTSPVNVVVDNSTSITGLAATGYSLSYQWYTCASDGTSATAITAAGTESYSGYNTSATLGLTPSTTGTKYFKCIVTDGCGGTAISNVVTVNVSNAMHSVSAVTSTGADTYGSVSSAAASVAEGGTTTITASPATGYQVTNWAVSGEGASIDPSGASSSNTTTLTMGTANATVTVTFGAKTYSVTLDRGNGTGGSGSVTMTYNSSSHSAITAPTAPTGYTFAGWYTGEGGTGSMVMNASGVLQASVAGYTGDGGIWTKDATCTLYAKYTANYPEGYLYITDVMATPETKAGYTITASATDAAYDGALDGGFSHSGLQHWAKASVKNTGVYTLTFSSALSASATAAGVEVDVWWGSDNGSSNAGTKVYINGTADSDEIGYQKTNSDTRQQLLEGLKNLQAVGTTSVSSIQLKCTDNVGSTWFRVGIKEIPGYLLTYDAGSGTGAPSASYQPNATITLSNTVPTRSGYVFRGWQVGGAGTIYAPGAEFSMPAEAVTLDAVWDAACMQFAAATSGSSETPAGTSKEISTATGGYASTLSGGSMTFLGRVGIIGNNDKYGLVFDSKDDELLTVTLSGAMLEAGAIIVLDCYSVNSNSKEVGFTISGNACDEGTYTTTAAAYQRFTRTYVVTEDDGIDGTSTFTIEGATTNKVYLKGMTVAGCTSCTSITPTLTYSKTTIWMDDADLTATPSLNKDGSTGSATYVSNNTDVAMVNESTGVVTAVARGTATITATIAADGTHCGKTATCVITVKDMECGNTTIAKATRSGTSASYTGADGGSALVNNLQTGTYKLTSGGYVGVQLPSTLSFEAGDIIRIDLTIGDWWNGASADELPVVVYADNTGTNEIYRTDNYTKLTAQVVEFEVTSSMLTALASKQVTVYRKSSTETQNHVVNSVEIKRYGCPDIYVYDDAADNGLWSDEDNWIGGAGHGSGLPTIDDRAIITKPVTVDIAYATAAAVILDQNSNTGKLTIQPNKGLEVAGTVTRTTDGSNSLATREEDLVLESSSDGNASLIFDNQAIGGGTNYAQATVMQYSKASIVGNTWNWQYVGTPFAGSIPQYNYYGSWMYKWDSGSWWPVHGSDELTPFAGYCLTQESATTHVMGGTLVPTTSHSVTISSANTDMVLANSWTAPIWIGGFTAETFTSEPATIYLFNTGSAKDGSTEGTTEAGTYITVPVNSGPYVGTEFIPSMQGFFVTTNGGSAGTITLKYDELVRSNEFRRAGSVAPITSGPMYAPRRAKAAETERPDVMKIHVDGSIYTDRVIILAREDFSQGFDNGWDGKKMSFGNESPSVYVINEQGGYDAVSAIPTYEGTVVGFRAGTDNECTIRFEYNGEETLYLNDLKEQTATPIDNARTYNFTTEAGDSEVRFIISATPIAKMPTGIDEVQSDNGQSTTVRKLMIHGQLYIIRGGRIFSAEGHLVK